MKRFHTLSTMCALLLLALQAPAEAATVKLESSNLVTNIFSFDTGCSAVQSSVGQVAAVNSVSRAERTAEVMTVNFGSCRFYFGRIKQDSATTNPNPRYVLLGDVKVSSSMDTGLLMVTYAPYGEDKVGTLERQLLDQGLERLAVGQAGIFLEASPD